MKREVVLPIAAGLLVAAALWAAMPHGKDGPPESLRPTVSSTSSATGQPAMLAFPFGAGNTTEGRNLTFVILAPLGRALAQATLNESVSREVQVDWQADRVGLADLWPLGCGSRSTCGQDRPSDADGSLTQAWALPIVREAGPGPRFGRDGYLAGNVTAYVFDERGLLVATNAGATEGGRFAGFGQSTRLPEGTWYLGNGTAPNGTQEVPGLAGPFVQRLLPQLYGLPVGGVASIRSNAYVGLYGTLFATVRIDSLVQVPPDAA